MENMLKVRKEPNGINLPKEHCCICSKPTPYWFNKGEIALCKDCAKTATPEKLPTKQDWIAKERRKEH